MRFVEAATTGFIALAAQILLVGAVFI